MWKGSFSTCCITLKVWNKSPWSNWNVLLPTHNTKQHWLEKKVCGTRQERSWSITYIMHEFYFHSYIYEQKIVDMKWWLVVVFSLQLNLVYFLPSFVVLEFKKKFTVLNLKFQFYHNGQLDSLGF
jgi:hypothetical protein